MFIDLGWLLIYNISFINHLFYSVLFVQMRDRLGKNHVEHKNI